MEERRFRIEADDTPDEKTLYAYDELGRREAVIEYAGSMVAAARSSTYAYDPVTGGLATETTPEGTIHREYDPATGRLTRTYTADNDTSYTYNDLGQLWKVAATKLNGQTANLVTEHTYTATGARGTTRHHNDPGSTADDVAWDYDYDQLNRLEVLNVSNGAGFHLLRQEITYESDGQRDQMLEMRYDGDSAIPFSTTRIDWTYDAIGRLTQEHRDEGDDGLGIDGLPDAGDYIHTYAHDLSGNRLEKAEDFGADGSATPDATTAYAYNERNQLTTDGGLGIAKPASMPSPSLRTIDGGAALSR